MVSLPRTRPSLQGVLTRGARETRFFGRLLREYWSFSQRIPFHSHAVSTTPTVGSLYDGASLLLSPAMYVSWLLFLRRLLPAVRLLQDDEDHCGRHPDAYVDRCVRCRVADGFPAHRFFSRISRGVGGDHCPRLLSHEVAESGEASLPV